MVMPDGITGRELVTSLQAEKPSLPVIYTSGYSADVVGKDFMLQDGLNFLQKPYSPRDLPRQRPDNPQLQKLRASPGRANMQRRSNRSSNLSDAYKHPPLLG
jgi:FixJ family two-component response regulator